MKQQDRIYSAIGLFVIVMLIFLIYGGYFIYQNYLRKERETYVMFFSGSLDGLNTKSPITYRGVKIGEVTRIEITKNPEKEIVEVPVYVQFFVERTIAFQTDPIRFLIDEGYIADISKPHLLTGTSSIQLIQSVKRHKPYFNYYKRYPIFPSTLIVEKSTTIDETLKTAQDTLNAIKDFVQSEGLNNMVNSMDNMADRFEKLADKINQNVSPSAAYFNQGMENISKAAHSVHEFTEYLNRYPESLIRGRA